MNTAVDDPWIIGHLPGTCPEMAVQWMEENNLTFTRALYERLKLRIQRHVKSMERFGMVEYRFEVRKGARIWHRKD